MSVQRWLTAVAALLFAIGFCMAVGFLFHPVDMVKNVLAVDSIGLCAFALAHL